MLVIHLRDDLGATHALSLDAARIVGRDPSCDLAFPQRHLDRQHARFFSEGSEARLVDHGSSAGTYLNGTLLRAATKLTLGDEVALGNVRVTVVGISES